MGASMFERFVDRARRLVVLAQEESRHLQHHYIGTEHLLLALFLVDDVCTEILHEAGLTYDQVKGDVVDAVGMGNLPVGSHIPFTPRSKKVLELSLREALRLGSGNVETRHIFLGLLREGEGVAAQVIAKHVALGLLQEKIVESFGPQPPEKAATSTVTFERDASRMLSRIFRSSPSLGGEGITERVRRVLSWAREAARGADADLEHVLIGLMRDNTTLAYRVLESYGINIIDLQQRIRDLKEPPTPDPEEPGSA